MDRVANAKDLVTLHRRTEQEMKEKNALMRSMAALSFKDSQFQKFLDKEIHCFEKLVFEKKCNICAVFLKKAKRKQTFSWFHHVFLVSSWSHQVPLSMRYFFQNGFFQAVFEMFAFLGKF